MAPSAGAAPAAHIDEEAWEDEVEEAPPAATQVGAAPMRRAAPSPSAPAARASRTSVPASQRGSRVNPRLAVAGPSRLSDRAIEEYHYVARDLRNIGMLIAVMVVILLIAFVAFTALGVGKTA